MSKLSQAQVEVVSDYLDLLSNGYINMFAVCQKEYWFIKVQIGRASCRERV